MVHRFPISTHSNVIDAIENCVTDRGSRDSNEVRSLASRRHWLEHDANSVTVDQYYGATPIYQKRQGSSGVTMVYQVQNRWTLEG